MNEEQREKVEMICKLWEDHEECCRTISNLTDFLQSEFSIYIGLFDKSTINIDFETKRAVLKGAINELNHLKETIEVKLSNKLGESCKQ